MHTDSDAPEGAIVLPRRASVAAIVGLIVTALGYAWHVSGSVTKFEARIENLEAADKRVLDRGDERWRVVTERLGALELYRNSTDVRLTRIEEQSRWTVDALGRIERKLDAPRR